MVNIFSDYAGQHKASSYDVTSILYMDLYESSAWETERRLVRDRYLRDGRRLSFKALGDRQRQQALIPFLQAANKIQGICITVAIRKSIRHICTSPETLKTMRSNWSLNTQVKDAAIERAARISHLIALLIAGLSKPHQDVYWFSDQDSLFANPRASADLGKMLGHYTSYYVNHPLGELGIGTTALDEGDRFEEDHAAIPDLAAGAVAEILSRVSTFAGGRLPGRGLAVSFPESFSAKTELLYSWLTDQAQNLRRLIVVFEDMGQSGLMVSRLQWYDEDSILR
jgi:hypothetical protein